MRDEKLQHFNDDSGYLSDGIKLSTERKNKLKRRLFSLPEEESENALFPCTTPKKILKTEFLPIPIKQNHAEELTKENKQPHKDEHQKERTLVDDLESITILFKKLTEAQKKNNKINRLCEFPAKSPVKFSQLRLLLVQFNVQIMSILERMLSKNQYGSAFEFCLASWILAEKIPREWNDEIMEDIACAPIDSIVDYLEKIVKKIELAEDSLVR
ncbi:unnamed protein product [Oikopleura dioica]|uniref:Uncharacterized protein n=1 Tax=Oikopleura dioica TaxID=34765 RepID=E4WWN3_OIKDI|nr:unnamed protein product [Oikopleura dioica]CBY32365.1 unnamed protein product [Oikopleura dioica]